MLVTALLFIAFQIALPQMAFAGHDRPLADIFGNTLCLSDAPAQSDTKQEHGVPDCCTVACAMFAALKSTTTDPLPNSLHAVLAKPITGTEHPFLVSPYERYPQGPRAPPHLV
jgi:hypothetical protein